MEFVSGIKLRTIFLDNGNWWKFFIKHRNLIRISIIINLLKLLVCRTSFLGYHYYICPCGKSIKVPHSCKSRFCSSCGKRATDNWMKTSLNKLPKTTWQHITFTMPDELWNFFWLNRHLMNKIPLIAASLIKKLSLQKGFIPGIYLALHTFGRNLKRNVHIHLSTTVGGLAPDYSRWIAGAYFRHNILKSLWKYEIVSLFQQEFKQGTLKLPSHLNHIKSYSSFSSWMTHLYNKTWVVHLNKQSTNMKVNVEYLGRYLKRPPLGETRIKAYDGTSVTFEFLDHYTDTQQLKTLPVLEFIAALIAHIPDKNFRNIRYYGFLSNKLSGNLLPIVYNLLAMKSFFITNVYEPWRNKIKSLFKYDPLQCPACKFIMKLNRTIFPHTPPLLSLHKEIALGYFKLI